MNNMADIYDWPDGNKPSKPNAKSAHQAMEVHFSEQTSSFHPGSKDMDLVNEIIDDDKQSPSQYHTTTVVKSNIPTRTYKPVTARRSQILKKEGGYLYIVLCCIV